MNTYLIGHYHEMMQALLKHIDLTITTLLIAGLIALPVGFIASRSKRFSTLLLGLFGMIYTIPSLALFALLIPFSGLGEKTALIVMALYAQFILLRNIILGFRSVNPAVIEAAKGMGLNTRQRFVQIELPLALPLIIGGFRLAAVTTAGLAAIAAWINTGGIGVILFEGIYQNHWPKLLTGTLLLAGFSLFLNQFLLSFEKDALANAEGKALL